MIGTFHKVPLFIFYHKVKIHFEKSLSKWMHILFLKTRKLFFIHRISVNKIIYFFLQDINLIEVKLTYQFTL